MIFSDNIYKIIDGKNVSLYANTINNLKLFIRNKSLKEYDILINLNRNCVFCREFNYSKIIQLNQNTLSIASNGYITIADEKEL